MRTQQQMNNSRGRCFNLAVEPLLILAAQALASSERTCFRI